MAGNKRKAQNLVIPPELQRIAKLRARLIEPDEQDVAKLKEWEDKVKRATIVLSLRGHEGIQIIIDRAETELREIDEVLRYAKPEDLSPEGALKYTLDQAALFARMEMWVWLRSLFTEAVRDIKEVRADLDAEDELDIPGI